MPDDSLPTLIQTRFVQGVWEGVLSGVSDHSPVVEAWHQDRAIEGVEVSSISGKAGRFAVRVPIPTSILSEGVQTVLLRSAGKVLAQFTVIAGVPIEDDLRAEISLLRAELELLKSAFRRHCAETAG